MPPTAGQSCCQQLGKDYNTLPYAFIGNRIMTGNKEVEKMYSFVEDVSTVVLEEQYKLMDRR